MLNQNGRRDEILLKHLDVIQNYIRKKIGVIHVGDTIKNRMVRYMGALDDVWFEIEDLKRDLFRSLHDEHAQIGLHSIYNCIPNDKIDSCPRCHG